MKHFSSIVLLLCAGIANAQTYPNTQPMPPAKDKAHLRVFAILYAGPTAQGLVESEAGIEASVALLLCSKSTAQKIASFYASGGFNNLPRLGEFFRAIAGPNCQDDVANYVMSHVTELSNPENAADFLASPREYAIGLKLFPLQRKVTDPPPSFDFDQKKAALAAGAVGLIGLLIWRKRRRANADLPA